jgi:hypothetical protein
MSIQLVLSHYLAGLRERNELDALLPELLKEMGHSVLSRPQIGVAQAGVDIVSTMAGEDGEEEVFLYVIKFGDVGRGHFYGGVQAIDPSVREACNTFIRNRLPEPLRRLDDRWRALPRKVRQNRVTSDLASTNCGRLRSKTSMVARPTAVDAWQTPLASNLRCCHGSSSHGFASSLFSCRFASLHEQRSWARGPLTGNRLLFD